MCVCWGAIRFTVYILYKRSEQLFANMAGLGQTFVGLETKDLSRIALLRHNSYICSAIVFQSWCLCLPVTVLLLCYHQLFWKRKINKQRNELTSLCMRGTNNMHNIIDSVLIFSKLEQKIRLPALLCLHDSIWAWFTNKHFL